MAGELSVTVDADYPDSTTDGSIKQHQEDHGDALHPFYNTWSDAMLDYANWPLGGVPFVVDIGGVKKWQVIDPEIAGSPGPTGVGFRSLGAWNSGTSYVNNSQWIDCVTYHGQLWACVTSNSNSAPTSINANWVRVVEGFYWRATWSSATTYDPGDLVQYGRHSYLCIARHSNSAPTDDGAGTPTASANWQPVAAGGIDGAQGSPGQSIIGPTGPAGPSAEEYVNLGNVSGHIDIDAGVATMYRLTLIGDADVDLLNASGTLAAAVTLRIYQGAGAPNAITWNNVTTWVTADENPPALGDTVDQVRVVIFDVMESEWFGYSPGVVGTPPPETFPALSMESALLVNAATASDVTADGTGLATYALGGSIQVGSKRGGVAVVVVARGDSTDPVVPSLTGGGVTWDLVTSRSPGTSTTRRLVAMFAAREATSGAAAQMVITLQGAASVVYTGAVIIVGQTGGAVPDTWKGYMVSKAKQRGNLDASENASTPRLTNNALASPLSADSRTVLALMTNSTAAALTPPSGFSVVDAYGNNASNPTMRCWILFNPTTFVTNPSGSLSANAEWALIGTEMEQGAMA